MSRLRSAAVVFAALGNCLCFLASLLRSGSVLSLHGADVPSKASSELREERSGCLEIVVWWADITKG